MVVVAGGAHRCTAAAWGSDGEWSDVAKLYVPYAGEGWVTCGGCQLALEPGMACFLPPHTRLAYGTSRRLDLHWAHFFAQSPLIHARLAAVATPRMLPAELARRCGPPAAALAGWFESGDVATGCRVQAMLLDVVAWALGEALPDPTAGGSNRERLVRALRYMEDRVTTPPSLAAMAREAGLSAEHFHRCFVRAFQVTPFAYLHRRRMARARGLLAGGALRVKEVAAACGYADPYYFSRMFRAHFGHTPAAVRAGRARVEP